MGRCCGAFSNYDYSDLGMTIAAAEVRVTKGNAATGKGIGLMPGGLGYHLGKPPTKANPEDPEPDAQGNTVGKAFFFFDPENGSILNKIHNTNGFMGAPGIELGMGVAPVTYITATGNTVNELFTSDSEGNVLYSDVSVGTEASAWKMKSIF